MRTLFGENTSVSKWSARIAMSLAGIGATIGSVLNVDAQDIQPSSDNVTKTELSFEDDNVSINMLAAQDTIPTSQDTVRWSGFGPLKIDSTAVQKEQPKLQKKTRLQYNDTGVALQLKEIPQRTFDKSAKDPLWMFVVGGTTSGDNIGGNWYAGVPVSDWISLVPEITLTGARFGLEASYQSPQPFPWGWDSYVSYSRQFSQAKLGVHVGPTIPLGKDNESFVKPAVIGSIISFPGNYVNNIASADFAAGVGVTAGVKIADLGKDASIFINAKGEFMQAYAANKRNYNHWFGEQWINSPNGSGEAPKRDAYFSAGIGLGIRFYDGKKAKPLGPASQPSESNAQSYQKIQEIKQNAESVRFKQQERTAQNTNAMHLRR